MQEWHSEQFTQAGDQLNDILEQEGLKKFMAGRSVCPDCLDRLAGHSLNPSTFIAGFTLGFVVGQATHVEFSPN